MSAMQTIEDLIKQYSTDEALRKEVSDMLADKKITVDEFMTFAKKHGVSVTMADVTKVTKFIKEITANK